MNHMEMITNSVNKLVEYYMSRIQTYNVTSECETYTPNYKSTHTRTHAHTHPRTRARARARARTRTRTRTRTHTHTHTLTHSHSARTSLLDGDRYFGAQQRAVGDEKYDFAADHHRRSSLERSRRQRIQDCFIRRTNNDGKRHPIRTDAVRGFDDHCIRLSPRYGCPSDGCAPDVNLHTWRSGRETPRQWCRSLTKMNKLI